jgi:hypothetical protein
METQGCCGAYTTLYLFDTYMYLFQAEHYPETRVGVPCGYLYPFFDMSDRKY